MKKLLLATTTLLLSIHLYSQGEAEFKNHKVGLNVGFSSATRGFAEVDANNSASGFAGRGLDLFLSYEYQPIEKLAFTVQYGGSTYSFQESDFSSELERTDGFEDINWVTSADDHAIRYTVVGLKATVGTRIQGYFNPVAGIGSYTSPELIVIASGPWGSVTQSLEETNPSSALIYGINMGVEFIASKLISININSLFLASEFEIETDFNTFDGNGNPTRIKRFTDQSFNTFNFTVGLGFNF